MGHGVSNTTRESVSLEETYGANNYEGHNTERHNQPVKVDSVAKKVYTVRAPVLIV